MNPNPVNKYNAVTAVFLVLNILALGYLTLSKANTLNPAGIALVGTLSAVVVSLRKKLFPDESPPQ